MARYRLLPVAGYLILRSIAAGFSPLPGTVPLDPLPILLAMWMRDRTHADPRALILLPALILGDLLAGVEILSLLLRCVMLCVFVLAPEEGGFHRRSWMWSFCYWLGTAIISDLQGWIPMGTVVFVGMLQSFLWWGLLTPRSGGGSLRPVGSLVGLPLAFVAVHLLLPSPSLWPLPEMGTHSSNWVRFFAILIFLEPAAWRILQKVDSRRPNSSRQDLYA